MRNPDSSPPIWQRQRERGSFMWLRVIRWIGLHCPRWLGRLILHGITIYYLCYFNSIVFRGSRKYLSKVLGKPARLRHMYRHYYTFSASIFDRIFLLSDKFEDFTITMHGAKIIEDYVEQKQGCILLGSHLGSFECMRVIGTLLPGLKVRPLMHAQRDQRMAQLLAELNPDIAASIIHLDSDAMLHAQEALENGEMIGVLADRIPAGGSKDKITYADFLSEKAAFPDGPFILASLMNVPVVFFTGLYTGDKTYEVHFEHFADAITLNRKQRKADLQCWIDKYAQKLEHYCIKSPYNWFNFYDFWDKD